MTTEELKQTCLAAAENYPGLRGQILDIFYAAEDAAEVGDASFECLSAADELKALIDTADGATEDTDDEEGADRARVCGPVVAPEPVRVETYCPIFPGFYATVFEVNEWREAEEISNILANNNVEISPRALVDLATDCRVITWDYTQYYRDYTEKIVEAVSHQLAGLGVRLEFESLTSPREYNYYNDVGNVCAIIDKPGDFKMDMMAFLLDHDGEFKSFIRRRFTSGPGFISFHSSDHGEWLDELRNWEPGTEGYDSTRFGTLLEFYLLGGWRDSDGHALYPSVEALYHQVEALYHSVEAPDLLEYCSGPLLDAANKPREEWVAACRQMEAYAKEKEGRYATINKQREGHEDNLVGLIRRWCE